MKSKAHIKVRTSRGVFAGRMATEYSLHYQNNSFNVSQAKNLTKSGLKNLVTHKVG